MNLRKACVSAVLVVGILPISGSVASGQSEKSSGQVIAAHQGDQYSLQNRFLTASVSITDGKLGEVIVRRAEGGQAVRLEHPFRLLLKDGAIFDNSSMMIVKPVQQVPVAPDPHASRLAARTEGESIHLGLESADHTLRVDWSMVLLDRSNYVRQELKIAAPASQDIPISRVELLNAVLPGARVVGSVAGSPIVAGNVFLGFEDPLSQSKVTREQATAWLDRDLPLRAGQMVEYSSVIGVVREGQLRRDFLAYLEQERAHPYRTFLHYNSWYDLGYFTPYSAADAVDRINAFGRELVEKRGVKMDSFLFDD